MYFSIYCKDKPDHGQVRLDNRPAHIEYLKQHAGKILAGGPMLNDGGDGMVGSLLIMDFADRAEAEAWAANDPYAQAGLFESVEIAPWKKVFPAD